MHVAIIGCGQLARMMALAGWPMGIRFSFLAGADENIDCVDGLGTVVRWQHNLEGEELYQALGCPDLVTVEKEQVVSSLLVSLEPCCPVYPQPEAIEVCQHRGREKALLEQLDIPIAPYRLADSAATLEAAVEDLGYPVFIKSCEEGYDGQNQWRLNNPEQLAELIGQRDTWPAMVVEAKVAFDRELSIIAVQSSDGSQACYPLTENVHQGGILIRSLAPAPDLTPSLERQAQQIVNRLLNHWGYVGVLTIECFAVGDQLVVNELAPRVHNSGHWTQGAGVCSQFENHLRATCGLGLGPTQPLQNAGMLNLLGLLPPASIASSGELQLHVYNKQIRPRRKVGHLNLQDQDAGRLQQRLAFLEMSLYSPEKNSDTSLVS